MNSYEKFAVDLLCYLDKHASLQPVHFHLSELSTQFGIRQEHLPEMLLELAQQRLIWLAAWDGSRERSWDEWPNPQNVFNQRTDNNHIRLKILAAGSARAEDLARAKPSVDASTALSAVLQSQAMSSWADIMKRAEAAKATMISNRSAGEQSFAALFQEHPVDGMIHFRRGEAYEALGESVLAAADFDRARILFPKLDWQNRATESLHRVTRKVPELLVFISHSSRDAELALDLIELLRGALGLRDEEIRCTSVDGFRLPSGANTGQNH